MNAFALWVAHHSSSRSPILFSWCCGQAGEGHFFLSGPSDTLSLIVCLLSRMLLCYALS